MCRSSVSSVLQTGDEEGVGVGGWRVGGVDHVTGAATCPASSNRSASTYASDLRDTGEEKRDAVSPVTREQRAERTKQ